MAHQPAQGWFWLIWGKRAKCVQTHLGPKACGRDERAYGHMPACCSLVVNELLEELQETNHFCHHRPF